MKIDAYTQFGGKHPETAAITNVLANQGFVSPHNGKPFSEEMILGIAGGLGCGYILWEFKKYDAAILVLGFQNRWNYTQEFMQNLCDRLGVSAEFNETGGQKTAQKHLEAAPILNNDGLNDAAEQYKALGQQWATFADAVLPNRIPPLGQTRKLLAQKYVVYNEKGGEGLEEVAELSGRLTDLEVELNSNLPLSEAEANALFAEMQEHLYGLYTAEKAALHTLKSVMG